MRMNFLHVLAMTSALTALPAIAMAADAQNPATTPAAPAGQAVDTSALLNLSLQQLSDVEVTSVSKKAEKASQAAAAIYVITQEDIRRSGMQSVPELLRMVPGLQVAQSGSQNWSITSRGFDSQFANKLLVLIDGRTVYTPLFSGVFWDVQNLMLEDIERIEVIRGPGATLWGANAVNGVINIITKSAKDTQGTLLTAAAGTQERAAGGARYGGTIGNLSYRTYAQYFDYAQQHDATNRALGVPEGQGAGDAWDNGQGGFRLDWGKSDKEQTTLQGDVYKGQENAQRFFPTSSTVSPSLVSVVNDTDDVSGANILGRWKHELGTGSDVTLQAYYDNAIRELFNAGSMGGSVNTQVFDFDFQHNLAAGSWNDVTWGLGYRRTSIDFGNDFYISFNPSNYYENLFSGFLQDKISLIQDRLFLTLGSKVEHNDFSGLEVEPSARIAWTPTGNQTIWASVSRAVHTPGPADQTTSIVLATVGHTSPTTFLAEQGNPNAVSEDLVAYELGYRIQPKENLSFDVTGFYNDYAHLASLQAVTAVPQTNPIIGPYSYLADLRENDNTGETHGVEAAVTWEVTKNFKLSGSYTLFDSDLHIVGASLVTKQGNAPENQFNIRSYVDLPYHMQFDTMLYRVNQLQAIQIPGYTRLDARLGWTPMPGVDLSLIGQNLLQSEHEEFSPFLYETQDDIGRSVLAKATLRF